VLVLNIDQSVGSRVMNEHMQSESWRGLAEFFSVAGVTVFGFIVLAVVSAALGYVLSSWGWRHRIAKRRARALAARDLHRRALDDAA
jgi:hypothetical protein